MQGTEIGEEDEMMRLSRVFIGLLAYRLFLYLLVVLKIYHEWMSCGKGEEKREKDEKDFRNVM